MAVGIRQQMTVEAFDQWVATQDSDYEYIGGEPVSVVSNNYASQIGMLIGSFITLFVTQHRLGWVTGADGGYIVDDERYIPDVGFIGVSRQPQPNRDAYNPRHPDLAVEVVSPTDDIKQLMIKVSHYLAAGTVVWVVYPDEREVHVYRSGQGARIFNEDDTLTTDRLPDFKLPVANIFPAEKESE